MNTHTRTHSLTHPLTLTLTLTHTTVYMTSHVDKLYGMIRSKALIQYFTPFASVQMPMMAQVYVCMYVFLHASASTCMCVCVYVCMRPFKISSLCSRSDAYGGAGLSLVLSLDSRWLSVFFVNQHVSCLITTVCTVLRRRDKTKVLLCRTVLELQKELTKHLCTDTGVIFDE
jgi:hypothetical protein